MTRERISEVRLSFRGLKGLEGKEELRKGKAQKRSRGQLKPRLYCPTLRGGEKPIVRHFALERGWEGEPAKDVRKKKAKLDNQNECYYRG